MYVMKFPIKPRSADSIVTTAQDPLTLQEINDIFASSIQNQIKLCDNLGVKISKDFVAVNIKENGREYQNQDEDKTILSETETIHVIELKFSIGNCESKFPLPFKINFGSCQNQKFVNFYGEILFKKASNNNNISVPLIGKGTAALEGRERDAHALPCINGHSACFQQKIAMIVSILAYFEINRDDIEIFRAHLLKLCDKFYGTSDMLNYICDKAFSLTELSYYDYLIERYSQEDEENAPIMLQHFKEFYEPHPLYFEYLNKIFTEEELNEELKDTSYNPNGPDKNPISPRVRKILNTFIFLDEVFMIKPYPGVNFKIFENEEVSIFDIAEEINCNSLEKRILAFKKLGLTIDKGKGKLRFSELGKRYTSKDRNVVSNEKTEYSFDLDFEFSPTNKENFMNIKIVLDQKPIDLINFFGRIEINKGFWSKIIIPLLGRGTISLDGHLNYKHAGFSTQPKTASFQQKVAILYIGLISLKINERDLQKFESFIKRINDMYHGLNDIIEYTFLRGKEVENESFLEYMKRIHMDYSKMPIVLKTIITYNRFPSKYYEELISQFTEKELIEEEKRIHSLQISNIIPLFLRKINFALSKINIF